MALNLNGNAKRAVTASPWEGGSFTVSFWAKRPFDYSKIFWSMHSVSDSSGPRMLQRKKELYAYYEGGTYIRDISSVVLTEGDWNLYTLVYSGFSGTSAAPIAVEIYINGVGTGSPGTGSIDYGALGIPTVLQLGSTETYSMAGEMAHFAFFEQALTPAQITELLTKVPDEIAGASPKVYYPLLGDTTNHGSGGSTYNLTLLDGAALSSTNDSTIPVSPSAPGTPPTGITTVTDIAPGTTSALVTYNYSAADQTGFEYRVGGGAAASIGASPATISGLAAGTPYSLEVRAINATGSGAWSAAYNFSTAAAGDTTPPTLTGVVSFTDVTLTGYTMSWPAGLDNVAVTGYEYQIGGTAGAWTDAGADLSEPVSGRTPGATETVYVRAYDAAGLRSSPPIAGTVTLLSASTDGTITVGSALYPIKYTSESVLNESGLRATVLDATTLAEVLNTSGVVCSAGVITITDPALVIGNTYHLVVKTAAGWTGFSNEVTAT